MNLTVLVLSFVAAFLMIFIIANVAKNYGYVDAPGGRKAHAKDAMPVGGLAIFCVIFVSVFILAQGSESLLLVLCLAVLTLAGAIDELSELGVPFRVALEVSVTLIMVFGAGIILVGFGDLFSFGDIPLVFGIGIFCTAVAVFGSINAWNMIDGMDGLAATIAIFSLTTYLVIIGSIDFIALIIIGSLGAFLVFNFSNGTGYIPKVFLGDAGSKLIGFLFVWYLIRDTQLIDPKMMPVTALYVMGIPIMDMTVTVVNRLRRGASPFEPDRTHIHHVLVNSGLSARQTYWCVVGIAAVLNVMGIIFHYVELAAYLQFLVYWVFFFTYFIFVSWRKSKLRF